MPIPVDFGQEGSFLGFRGGQGLFSLLGLASSLARRAFSRWSFLVSARAEPTASVAFTRAEQTSCEGSPASSFSVEYVALWRPTPLRRGIAQPTCATRLKLSV